MPPKKRTTPETTSAGSSSKKTAKASKKVAAEAHDDEIMDDVEKTVPATKSSSAPSSAPSSAAAAKTAAKKTTSSSAPSSSSASSASAAAKKTTSSSASSSSSSSLSDPFKLEELFAGGEGGAAWGPILIPVINSLPEAANYIGPERERSLIPVRELTFQAMKPNPPSKWKVVIFGEKPYPRIESATGISFFDADFDSWDDSRFGSVRSMKCIMKSALMGAAGIDKNTPIDSIKTMLKERNVVRPSEWFQSILTQGCLLINAAFTASLDDSISATKHASFWRPVVVKIIEEILAEKEKQKQGVVFAWWGNHAKNVEAFIQDITKKYRVPIKHVRASNPAARNDAFCDTMALKDINDALEELNMDTIDWLPTVGWDKASASEIQGESSRFANFIQETKDLHKFFLERLQGVGQERMEALPAISGVRDTVVKSLKDATKSLAHLQGLAQYVTRSENFSQTKKCEHLTAHEVSALYLYTCESKFYKSLNEALRTANEQKIKPYFGVLNLLTSALEKLRPFNGDLWRGVKVDLRSSYTEDSVVGWWGVSSCTSNKKVAEGFLGSSGTRTLFQVKPKSAVSIKEFSAFQAEEEFLLRPGTQLKVLSVKSAGGLTTIVLEETDLPPLVT